MISRTGAVLAVATAALLAGSAVHVKANELGFLEMLFGLRPAPRPAPYAYHPRPKVGAVRHRLHTRYAALPVKIRIKEKDLSGRQTSIDMKDGAAAAFMKDETLRPGDIVVLNSGARVFTGSRDKTHAMSDFEPVRDSRLVSTGTRRQLASLLAPAGALPADEARRVLARMRDPAARNAAAAAPAQALPQSAAMRVINPWQTGR